MTILSLPYEEVWVLDTEFVAKPGERPSPVCLVARELGSGRLLRIWEDDLGPVPPFRTDAGVLFVAFFASAEWSVFLKLGWPLPERILDLYFEFRLETNGKTLGAGRGLLGAMSYHGLMGITKVEKQDMRNLIMSGGPFDAAQREAILDYCQGDVDPLGALLERMLPAIRAGHHGLGRALLRGRYSRAVARMEHDGIPIDTGTLDRLRRNWDAVRAGLVEAVDSQYGVYSGTSFVMAKFGAYLEREDIQWPRLESGALALDSRTFRSMSRAYPQLNDLKELRTTMGELRLMDLAVGPDGRNRTLISPFQSRTGRNQPSNSRFIFGPSVWVRNLIVPEPGRAVAYLDWKSQEVAIAAAMSGDKALQGALDSGDPYLDFAIRAGMAPTSATKATHPQIRDACKSAVLGSNYGMGPRLLSEQTGLSLVEATEVLRRLRSTFPDYFAWAQGNVDQAQMSGAIETVLGWRQHVTTDTKPNSLLNFPMQAHGAEMLRLAACTVTEAGISVVAPVHDALLIEEDEEAMEGAAALASELMEEASRVILGGWTIGTDLKVVGPGERYSDPRGDRVWGIVNDLMDRGGMV